MDKIKISKTGTRSEEEHILYWIICALLFFAEGCAQIYWTTFSEAKNATTIRNTCLLIGC